MILTNRLFERQPPSKLAKSIFIFCEGIKREYQYFTFFKEKDSRINIEIYKLKPNENNTPKGLFEIAEKSLIVSEANPEPKYDFQEGDEVWLIFDTDIDKDRSRENQINSIRSECESKLNWNISESNPCFEVWLYYHIKEELIEFEDDNKCKTWKQKVGETISGGFDPRRHPILIDEAATNSKKNFKVDTNNRPIIGSTEVFKIAGSIIEVLGEKLNRIKSSLN